MLKKPDQCRSKGTGVEGCRVPIAGGTLRCRRPKSWSQQEAEAGRTKTPRRRSNPKLSEMECQAREATCRSSRRGCDDEQLNNVDSRGKTREGVDLRLK
ncbi:hypothetical protein SDJN03_26305, partial [Cucurbita argyrosperma subsp. sororia]